MHPAITLAILYQFFDCKINKSSYYRYRKGTHMYCSINENFFNIPVIKNADQEPSFLCKYSISSKLLASPFNIASTGTWQTKEIFLGQTKAILTLFTTKQTLKHSLCISEEYKKQELSMLNIFTKYLLLPKNSWGCWTMIKIKIILDPI
jgi:hypothetical protein